MLSLLVVSLAVTVSAQYGGPSNDVGTSYPNRPSYPVYYPPIFGDWSSGSREHRRHRKCPRLQTYLGELPSVPTEAFYPPIIRYVRFGRQETALVVCDRDPKNTNILFARRNETRDLRAADVASLGTTAGLVLTCDRRERRYVGNVLNITNPPSFTKKREITQFTCLGLDKTVVGLAAEQLNKNIAQIVALVMSTPAVPVRRKREAETVTEEVTEAVTEAATEVVTEAAPVTEAVTEAAVPVTEAAATEAASATEASATEAAATATEAATEVADPSNIDLTSGPITDEIKQQIKDPQTAVQVAIANIGKLLGSVF